MDEEMLVLVTVDWFPATPMGSAPRLPEKPPPSRMDSAASESLVIGPDGSSMRCCARGSVVTLVPLLPAEIGTSWVAMMM